MVRNLEKRLELMIPIEEERDQMRIKEYLEACFKDNTNAYKILPDGRSERIIQKKGKAFRFQEHLYRLAKEQAATKKENTAMTTFQPHTSIER